MGNFSVNALLIITYDNPYPPSSGGRLRNWQHINVMLKFGSISVCSVFPGNPISQSIPGVSLYQHYDTSDERCALWEKMERRFWWSYHCEPRRATLRYTKTAAQGLEEILTKLQPNLVISDIWAYRYMPLFKSYGCRLIGDEHNVEAIALKNSYEARYLAQNRKPTINERMKGSLELLQTRSIELKSLCQADQVWTCSEVDDQRLQELYGEVSHSRVIPNGIDVAHYEDVRLGRCSLLEELKAEQKNLLYLGFFSYSPNALAAELLIEQIYPSLRQVYPDCRLLLVGRRPTQRMLEAAKQDSGIIVTGEVTDVRPYLAAASVMVVPLQHGSGTRLKILEAFAAGCPVVTTAKGAEGLKAKNGEHLLIREEIEAIIEGVCQLWSDPSLGQKLANSAYELVKAEYSWSVIGQKVESAIQELF